MDTGESQLVAPTYIKSTERGLHVAGGDIGPADEPHIVIEKEIALGLALTYQQSGHGIRTGTRLELLDIQIRNDIDVMHKKILAVEQRPRKADSAACIPQQFPLIGKPDVQRGKFRRIMHIINDLVGEMMDIDDKIINACIPQPHQDMIQKSMPGQRGQRLGKIVCQWLESCSETCRKHHRSHARMSFRCPVPCVSR